MQCKHHEKKKLKKDIKALSIQLKSCSNNLIYSVLLHKFNIAVRSRSNAVSKRHVKKLFNLRKQKDQRSLNDEEKQSKNIIHNFQSYSLTKEEVEALSYGLDQNIPNYTHRNTINTEFGLFFSKCFK